MTYILTTDIYVSGRPWSRVLVVALEQYGDGFDLGM